MLCTTPAAKALAAENNSRKPSARTAWPSAPLNVFMLSLSPHARGRPLRARAIGLFRDSVSGVHGKKAASLAKGFWRQDYNHHRPHSSLGHLTPNEFAMQGQETALETAKLSRLKVSENRTNLKRLVTQALNRPLKRVTSKQCESKRDCSKASSQSTPGMSTPVIRASRAMNPAAADTNVSRSRDVTAIRLTRSSNNPPAKAGSDASNKITAEN